MTNVVLVGGVGRRREVEEVLVAAVALADDAGLSEKQGGHVVAKGKRLNRKRETIFRLAGTSLSHMLRKSISIFLRYIICIMSKRMNKYCQHYKNGSQCSKPRKYTKRGLKERLLNGGKTKKRLQRKQKNNFCIIQKTRRKALTYILTKIQRIQYLSHIQQ